jgi:RNA polymerase sigma-70 factor (family 1)
MSSFLLRHKNSSEQVNRLEQSIENQSFVVEDKEFFLKKVFETDPQKGAELLYTLYYKPLCSHAVRFVYSKELAEDLVGEVFFKFLKRELHKEIKISFRAYLFTAVRYNALTYLRCEFDKNKTSDINDIQEISDLPDPAEWMQYDELYLKIEKTIKSLSPQIQKIFVMSRFEGKQNKAIAGELAISLKTVEAHITSALKKLRLAVIG